MTSGAPFDWIGIVVGPSTSGRSSLIDAWTEESFPADPRPPSGAAVDSGGMALRPRPRPRPGLRRPLDASQHPSEDAVVDGGEQVPVGEADIAERVKDGRLTNHGLPPRGIDFELQPQPSGDLHLRRQAQQMARLQALDAPEVDRVADSQVKRIPAPAAPPDAAAQRVEQAPQPPEPVGRIPTGIPADALDRHERVLGLALH